MLCPHFRLRNFHDYILSAFPPINTISMSLGNVLKTGFHKNKKVARVVPVFQKVCAQYVGIYRQIYLTSVF